jgi:hypothetical protein
MGRHSDGANDGRKYFSVVKLQLTERQKTVLGERSEFDRSLG